MNFEIINDLPIFDLQSEFQMLIEHNTIKWHSNKDQICLNTTADRLDDYWYGRGSLWYDWDSSYTDAIGKTIIPTRDKALKESDFNHLCNAFKNTLFEEVYRALDEKYFLGRVRLMLLKPKSCLTWHTDNSIRIHFPIITSAGCLMVIGNEATHLTKNTWWKTNTLIKHTALNGSTEDRIHLVATVLGEK